MDISARQGWPLSVLSNFAPHEFTIDGVKCGSMEGFLQSLKFKDPNMQEEVCKLIGFGAKYKGKPKKWWQTQTLWWRGAPYDRHGKDYQDLLDRAYDALSNNEDFKKALLATQNGVLTHKIGKRDPHHTVLTEQEFCSRLTKLRTRLKEEQK